MRILSILALVIVVVTKSVGQHSLQGRVTGQDKHSLGLVAVSLSENTDSSLTLNTLTNQGGAFRFNVPHAGQYRVLISALGYETQKKAIQINGAVDLGTTVLREKAEELAEVTVTGNAGTQAKREQPIMVEVFDLKKSHLKSSTLPQLLNLSSGIKVRQSAGVGSETTLNLNGLQGKA
ncbi:carboxypeptidase-like regulatory domain-containing protein, partial [Microcoleus sp. herbarium8]|uniref:carboxypeptidase regulatory-like domain-containing protein n=1 Tax=Microcoleus sp. herbarium8 TaxID=3055436 RepID=UPI002FD12AB4